MSFFRYFVIFLLFIINFGNGYGNGNKNICKTYMVNKYDIYENGQYSKVYKDCTNRLKTNDIYIHTNSYEYNRYNNNRYNRYKNKMNIFCCSFRKK